MKRPTLKRRERNIVIWCILIPFKTALLILSLEIRYLTIKGTLMCILLQVTWVVRLYADIMDIDPMESAVGFRSMPKYWKAGLVLKKLARLVWFLKPKVRACPRAAGKRTQRLFVVRI